MPWHAKGNNPKNENPIHKLWAVALSKVFEICTLKDLYKIQNLVVLLTQPKDREINVSTFIIGIDICQECLVDHSLSEIFFVTSRKTHMEPYENKKHLMPGYCNNKCKKIHLKDLKVNMFLVGFHVKFCKMYPSYCPLKSRDSSRYRSKPVTFGKLGLGRMKCQAFSSWWLNQPIWKILVNLGSFPQVRMNIKKYLKPPPSFAIEDVSQLGITFVEVYNYVQ